ncbi:MAG: GGDEF domain-containing protein [Gammaproteobacteria bacterium]|nr:GGDEF domain-containing protein [Gammaproteobacteria bacterium]
MTSTEQISREHLSQFKVFHNQLIDPIWELLRYCEVRNLSEGEVLLEKNQANRTMFLVLSGTLKVYLDDEHQRVAAELGQGQTVGELSVIDGSAASAHVVSTGETSLLCVNEKTFWRLTRASHGFCTSLLLLLSLRMRSSNISLEESENLQWKFEQQALTDGLTGIYNRRWLDQMLPRLLLRSEQDNLPFCVLMIDVDHFKKFNDNYGHAIGDNALCKVADTLVKNVRPIDLVARYGGEEFCVLLPETDLQSGIGAGTRTRKAIHDAKLCDSNGKPIPGITISAGLAERRVGDSADDMLKRADQALYLAKAQGRDRLETSAKILA